MPNDKNQPQNSKSQKVRRKKKKRFDTKENGRVLQEKRQQQAKTKAIEILKKTLGNVSATCDHVGITRQTFYNWRQEDQEFNRAVEEISERTLDFVESKLMQGIQDGNTKLIMFYLNCKGKKRGYGLKDTSENEKSSGLIINISQEEADY